MATPNAYRGKVIRRGRDCGKAKNSRPSERGSHHSVPGEDATQEGGPSVAKTDFLRDGRNPYSWQNVLIFILNIFIIKTG